MATKNRKEQRQKELVNLGREAEHHLAAKAASEEALAKSMDAIAARDKHIESLKVEHAAALGRLMGSRETVTGLEESIRLLRAANLAFKNEITELVEENTRLRGELADIKIADRDAASLRRRLKAKTEKIEELQGLLSQQRREANW